MKKYPDDEFIHICEAEADLDIWQCINCGAYADKKQFIIHYKTCKVGEAKHWEKFYDEANAEEAEYERNN